MSDPDRPQDPHRPPHPGGHPRHIVGARSTTWRWIGIAAAAVVAFAVIGWLVGGGTVPEDHELGEPAGVGVPADPEEAVERAPALETLPAEEPAADPAPAPAEGAPQEGTPEEAAPAD